VNNTFANKVVLVTGASSGIGRALACRFAQAGCRLALTARREDRLVTLRDELGAKHKPVIVQADLTEPEACERVVERATAEAGPIDVLVNNAGLGEYGLFERQPPDAQRQMIRLNCEIPVALSRIVLPAMLSRRSGWILNVASMAGFQPTPYMSGYGATKAFLVSFSLGLRTEVRGRGVTVTCLCPGRVRTEFFDRGGFERYREAIRRTAAVPDRVAESAIRALARGRAICVPGRLNGLLSRLTQICPPTLSVLVAQRALRPPE
jgi:short-subunit dehydrogenase